MLDSGRTLISCSVEASTGCRWGKPASRCEATDAKATGRRDSRGREMTPEWGPKNGAPARAHSTGHLRHLRWPAALSGVSRCGHEETQGVNHILVVRSDLWLHRERLARVGWCACSEHSSRPHKRETLNQ